MKQEQEQQSGVDYFWRQVNKYLDEYQKDLFIKFYENAKVIEQEKLDIAFQNGELAIWDNTLSDGLEEEKKPIEDIRNTTAEKILHKNIDWVFASDDDKNKFIKAMNEFAEMKAKEFAQWIDNNNWICDPFPRKEFNDNLLRYSNIATIDIYSDNKIERYFTNRSMNDILTIDELYELFKKENI